MEGTSIIAMSGGFIALAIMLSIGTLILGGSVTDCSGLQGSPQSQADSANSATWTRT